MVLDQLVVDHDLVAMVQVRCRGVVGGDTEPSVAVLVHAFFQVPSRYIGCHTGVQELLGGNPKFSDFLKMYGVDARHSHIQGAVVVSPHLPSVEARLHHQNRSEDSGVDLVVGGGTGDALLIVGGGGGYALSLSVRTQKNHE